MLLQHIALFAFNIVLFFKWKKQKSKELRRRYQEQKRTPKINAQSYIYIMQVIRSLSFSGIDFCVSAAYNWHYVLRAPPNSRTPYAPGPRTKTAKKQSKGMQAPHWPARSKKARPRQAPIMSN